jgi:hypothetical protein
VADGSGRDRPCGDPDATVPGRKLDPEAGAERRLVPPEEPDRARRDGGDGVPRGHHRGRRVRSGSESDEFSRWIRELVGLDPDVAVVIAVVLSDREPRTVAELVAATEPVDDCWYHPDTRTGPVVLTVRSDPETDAYTFSESYADPIADTAPVAPRP